MNVFESWLSLPVAVLDEVVLVNLEWVGRLEEGLNDVKDRVPCLARTRTVAATEAEGRTERVASLEGGKKQEMAAYMAGRCTNFLLGTES